MEGEVRELSEIVYTLYEKLSAMMRSHKPLFYGERYITDHELSERLKVSRRTLQNWRDDGNIPFIVIGGKILYKESDIEKKLEENYVKAYR